MGDNDPDGRTVGTFVGGGSVVELDGEIVGASVGCLDGDSVVGESEGAKVVGGSEGDFEGDFEGDEDGIFVGAPVNAEKPSTSNS